METQLDRGTPIRTTAELEAFGVPEPKIRDKVLPALEDVHKEWLGATSLVLIATATPDGRCDVSPKGDPAGFIKVLDDRTIAIPERPGNKRMDGFHNILANPHAGLLCLIPGRSDTLRINGAAQVVRDAPFLSDMVVKRHEPKLALVIDVEEVFFHCPKAFRRSKTWNPDAWDTGAARTYAEIALDLWRKGEDRQEVLSRYQEAAYDEGLYTPSG